MSFLTRTILRAPALRPAALSIPHARVQVRFATQGYGTGDGDPAGEKPQKQGASTSESLEHPGPAAPDVAKGKSSSSPNKETSSSSSNQSEKSKAPSNKRKFSTSTRRFGGEEPAVKQGQQNKPKKSEVEGAKPKILDEKAPSGEEQSEEVKKHNEEMRNRAEQAHEGVPVEDAEAGRDKTGKR